MALVSSVAVFCPSLVRGQFGCGKGAACGLGRDTALLSMRHGVQKMGSYVDLVSCVFPLAQYMALAMGQLLVALVEMRPSLYVLSLSFHLCFSSSFIFSSLLTFS